jgi:hypothetical protein
MLFSSHSRKNSTKKSIVLSLFGLLCFNSATESAFGQLVNAWDDSPPLDPPYQHLIHPMPELNGRPLLRRRNPKASDTLSVIQAQSAVKSQGSRGSCSHFSAVGMVEAALVARGEFPTSVDLSEQWMAYLQGRNTASDGSTSVWNFQNLRAHGIPTEQAFPYVDRNWESLESDSRARARCGQAKGFDLKACLLAHWDPRLLTLDEGVLLDKGGDFFFPEFVDARREAAVYRDEHLNGILKRRTLWSEEEIKSYLADGIPVLLDIDFYYGAWNHRVGVELGIVRKDDEWAQGIVTYPEVGSIDRDRSGEKPAGHSVLLVGYDDDREVTTNIQMSDGTTRSFRYRGVYYFKNSWGTSSFGSQFQIQGLQSPGYGVITQRYAREEGGFFTYFE